MAAHTISSATHEGTKVSYPSGHIDRLDVAVRRNVLTGVNQTMGQVSLQYADEFGCDIMEITAHSGARPSHAVWQGELVSRSGKRGYLSLDDIGYGTGAGFMGWNCRHSWNPFFEGISTRNYTPEKLRALNAKNVEYNGRKYTEYEASQIQRSMEREIRATKRELSGLDEAMKHAKDEQLGNGLQADFTAASKKLKEQERVLKDMLEQTSRRADNSRTQVQGFGRSQAQKAVWAAKKGVANPSKSATMKPLQGNGGAADVQIVGKLDKKLYSVVTPDITTDEVIITEERIQHILDHHPGDYEKFARYLPDILSQPDYILEANQPNSAFVLKRVEEGKTQFEMILRLHTSEDVEGHKNSIITFLKVEEKRYNRYLRTKKILYKRE